MTSKLLGAIFLICGTSIGAGILGVPSVTVSSGLMNSLILFFICWIFSTVAALYYMEAHLWQENPQSNLLSMTEAFFGSTAKCFVWIIYLGLLYSLMCTYLLAGSSWIVESLGLYTSIRLTPVLGMICFILLIGLFIFFGIRAVDKVNRIMSLGLALCFLAILYFILPTMHVSTLLEKQGHWSSMSTALPLLITAFGYSIIIPSLNIYFNKQAYQLQKAVFIGSLLTLLVYVLWQIGTFGNIPLEGTHGLSEIAKSKDNGTEIANALIYFSHNNHLNIVLTLFAVFAVITSFLGVSMALYHALADGFKLKVNGISGFLILLLTYVPPIVFLLVFPTGFSQILSCAGALVALLMGLVPVAMVWKGRYFLNLKGYRVWGGKSSLIIVGLFFALVVVAEILR